MSLQPLLFHRSERRVPHEGTRALPGTSLPRRHASPPPVRLDLSTVVDGSRRRERVERLVRLTRETEGAAAVRYVDQLVDGGMSAEVVLFEVIQPAARRLGLLWDEDEVDFVEVTVAVGRMQRLVRRLQSRLRGRGTLAPEGPGPSILLCGWPREEPTLGLMVVGELFVSDGWIVTMAAPLGEGAADRLAAGWFDAVGFSLGSDRGAAWLREEIARARESSKNPGLVVLVGGPGLQESPGRASMLGADAYVADGRETCRVARTLVAKEAARTGRVV